MKRTIGFVSMGAIESSAAVHANARRRLCASSAMLVGAFAACGLLAPVAYGHEPQAPEYSLKIVQGETTQPEDSIANVSAGASNHNQVRVRIIQGGTVVNQNTNEGWAWLDQVPPVGDTVTVESPLGTVVGTAIYDGLPSIDPTVCATSTNFSGRRSGADEVQGGYYTDEPQVNPYGHIDGYEHTHRGEAQVTLLSGSSFGGNFLNALQFGETVWATETVKSKEPGWIFTYESETARPVGACPAPPPPPPSPAKPVLPPLQASLAKIRNATIRALLMHGLSDRVTINQPGTVTQDLYLQGGSVPATAASRRHKHKPPALLLARGSAHAKSAGTVSVSLKLTVQGRRKLSQMHSVKAVLVTTLRSSSGTKLNLAPRTVTLHR